MKTVSIIQKKKEKHSIFLSGKTESKLQSQNHNLHHQEII